MAAYMKNEIFPLENRIGFPFKIEILFLVKRILPWGK